METACVERMSDGELVARLVELLGEERRLTAAVLVHLGEVEARRLYLPAACPSMFVYCTRVLGMSEDQAFKRIRAARAVRRYPAIGAAVAEGRLHLSGVVLLAPHITGDNVEELVAEASSKSKAEIEMLVARRAPRADVPERLERVAEQGQLVAPGAPGPAGQVVAPASAGQVVAPGLMDPHEPSAIVLIELGSGFTELRQRDGDRRRRHAMAIGTTYHQAAEHEDRKNSSPALGVSLVLTREVQVLGSSPDDLLHEQGDSADEEEQLETLSRSASAMPQGPAPAQILHVAKGLLDAHPPGEDRHDGLWSRRERRRQQPWLPRVSSLLVIDASLADATASCISAAVAGLGLLRQHHSTFRRVLARKCDPAQVPGAIGRASMYLLVADPLAVDEHLRGVSYAADEIPPDVGYRVKPRRFEAGICHKHGTRARQDLTEVTKEANERRLPGLAAPGDAGVHDERAARKRNARDQREPPRANLHDVDQENRP